MLMYIIFLMCFGASTAQLVPTFLQEPHIIATGKTTILLHCSATDVDMSPPSITWMARRTSFHSWSHSEGNVSHSYAVVTSRTSSGSLYCRAQGANLYRNSRMMLITENHFTCDQTDQGKFRLLLVMTLMTTGFVVAILILYALYVVKSPSRNAERGCTTVSAAVDAKPDKSPDVKEFNNLKVKLMSLKDHKGNYNYRRFSTASDV